MTTGFGESWGSEWVQDDSITPTSAPIDYYKRLFTSQYQSSSKLLSFAGELFQKVEDVRACALDIDTKFDIDSAVGVQLDVIGTIIGANRVLPFQPSGGLSPVLTDTDYRLLIRAKIYLNTWDGKKASIYPIWKDLFPGGTIIIQDIGGMKRIVTMSGSFSSIVIDMINNGMIIPRPQGVLDSYGWGDLPFFGFDQSDGYIAGPDDGKMP